jgi:phosphatidylglycerophosphate synthase
VIALRSGLTASLVVLLVLLTALASTVGLSVQAWGVGLACGLLITATVARGVSGASVPALGPADLVTLTRACLACGVAALVVESFLQRHVVPTLLVLAIAALVLDAVDGPVARRTRTETRFGARFDGEADAFLILVLSVYVARSAGAWVLLIGAARYAFGLAGWPLPWLRGELPSRYWRKMVAAVQGTVLTVAVADVLPRSVTVTALAVALALLTESFGRDVLWLWTRRPAATAATARHARHVHLPTP